MRFRSPFSDAHQVRDLVRRYLLRDANQPITDAQILAAGAAILRGEDLRGNLRLVFRWKLESFLPRFPWVRSFPDSIPDATLINAVAIARKALPTDKASVRAALQKLDDIPYVGVPVASAFMTAMHPDRFTVTDRQAYKSLGCAFQDGISEYLEYLAFCHAEAKRLAVTLREHDQALWQYGKDLGTRSC